MNIDLFSCLESYVYLLFLISIECLTSVLKDVRFFLNILYQLMNCDLACFS
jgi:hypothetical protein